MIDTASYKLDEPYYSQGKETCMGGDVPDNWHVWAHRLADNKAYFGQGDTPQEAVDAVWKTIEEDSGHVISDEQVKYLRAIQKTIHESCRAAGWYSDLETGAPIKRNFGEVIALMHSELSEALEGWRKNLMDDHLPTRKMTEVELADTIIRILDTAQAEGLDIAGAMQEKFEYNQTREDHQIENRRKKNGKKI
jgi:hypothetical protein